TFALLWSFRGAPHLHRRADLPGLVSALWPLNEADAMSRLPAERAALRAADMSALDAFSAVARALRSVVRRPLSKGEVRGGHGTPARGTVLRVPSVPGRPRLRRDLPAGGALRRGAACARPVAVDARPA